MNPPFPGGRGVAFSPDGKWVAWSDGFNSGIKSLSPNGGAGSSAKPGELDANVAAPIVWSPDSKYLAHLFPSGDANENWIVGIMGVTPDTKPRNLDGHRGKVFAIAWSHDGKAIATGGTDGFVILWDAATWKELRRVKLDGTAAIRALVFTPDNATLAAGVQREEGREIHRIVLIEAATGKELDFAAVGAPVRSVAFSPDGKTILAAYGIDRVALRAVMTPAELEASGGIVLWTRKVR